jgi:Membrane MotB of proton-channel complex MotA/MotB/CheB methylesterase
VEETRGRIRSELIPKVKELCWRNRGALSRPLQEAELRKPLAPQARALPGRVEIVAIGTSTGGPNALAALLPALKEDFSVPIVVVVSYADFITLLFAFFVVLYSSSPVDKRKVGRLAMAIQVACQELGVFDTSNTKVPLSDTEPIPFANIQAVENVERTGDMERFVHPTKGFSAPRPRTVR